MSLRLSHRIFLFFIRSRSPLRSLTKSKNLRHDSRKYIASLIYRTYHKFNMDKNSIIRYKTSFDDIAQYIEGDNGEQVEVWFARDLMPVLGYARWENF